MQRREHGSEEWRNCRFSPFYCRLPVDMPDAMASRMWETTAVQIEAPTAFGTMLISWWLSIFCRVNRSPPFLRYSLANVCLNVWGETRTRPSHRGWLALAQSLLFHQPRRLRASCSWLAPKRSQGSLLHMGVSILFSVNFPLRISEPSFFGVGIYISMRVRGE